MHAERMTREDREAYGVVRDRFERGDLARAREPLEALARRYPRYADLHYMIGILREREHDLDGAADEPGARPRAESVLRRGRAGADHGLRAARPATSARASSARGSGPRRERRPRRHDARASSPTCTPPSATRIARSGELREASRPTARRSIAARATTTSASGSPWRCARPACPARAIAEFQRVLRANPDYLDAQVQLGVTYYTLGRAAEARDEWNATLERDPSRDDARMYLRLLAPTSADRRRRSRAARPAQSSGDWWR